MESEENIMETTAGVNVHYQEETNHVSNVYRDDLAQTKG